MDKSKKTASKKTLSELMDNSSNIIREMYACLKADILTFEQLEEWNAKQICILCQQLSIAVNYSLMDIGVSVRASIGLEKAYEKRFHLKNLKASISESYRLIKAVFDIQEQEYISVVQTSFSCLKIFYLTESA